jgi:hypothetical protein
LRKGEPIRAFHVLRRNGDGLDRRFELSGLPTVAPSGQLEGYRGVALPATAQEGASGAPCHSIS